MGHLWCTPQPDSRSSRNRYMPAVAKTTYCHTPPCTAVLCRASPLFCPDMPCPVLLCPALLPCIASLYCLLVVSPPLSSSSLHSLLLLFSLLLFSHPVLSTLLLFSHLQGEGDSGYHRRAHRPRPPVRVQLTHPPNTDPPSRYD